MRSGVCQTKIISVASRASNERISVAFLIACLANAMSVAEIVDAYPTLTKNAVQGALRELAKREG